MKARHMLYFGTHWHNLEGSSLPPTVSSLPSGFGLIYKTVGTRGAIRIGGCGASSRLDNFMYKYTIASLIEIRRKTVEMNGLDNDVLPDRNVLRRE